MRAIATALCFRQLMDAPELFALDSTVLVLGVFVDARLTVWCTAQFKPCQMPHVFFARATRASSRRDRVDQLLEDDGSATKSLSLLPTGDENSTPIDLYRPLTTMVIRCIVRIMTLLASVGKYEYEYE